jgi:hypothetical protein
MAALRAYISAFAICRVLKGFQKEGYLTRFSMFWLWCICVVEQWLATASLLFSGVFRRLGPALVDLSLHSFSVTDTVIVLLFFFYAVITYAIYGSGLRSMATNFIEAHAFVHWQNQHQLPSTFQLRDFRIPEVALRRSSLISYSFSGQTMVLRIGKKQPPLSQRDQEQSIHEATQGMESLASISKEQEQQVTSQAQGIIVSAEPAVPVQEEERGVAPKQKVPSTLVLFIVIGQAASFYLAEVEMSGQTEKIKRRVEVFFNSIQEAILLFLATRKKDAYIKRENMLRTLYGEEPNDSIFHNDTRRMREQISKVIAKEFPDRASEGKTLDPLKKQKKGKEPMWSLSECCRIVGLEEVDQCYQKLVLRGDKPRSGKKEHEYGMEALATVGQRLIKRYSDNYLSEPRDEEKYVGGWLFQYLDEAAFDHWVGDVYAEYRYKYISVLKHIAACAERVLAQNGDAKWARTAAELYKECAYAATCGILDDALGEDALRRCITMYMQDHQDTANAERVCEIYGRRVRKRILEWTPEQETRRLLVEWSISTE